MIRSERDNTIISYHCSEKYGSISAADLCTRLQLVGRSVYWSIIFRDYVDDATFVLVSMLWYALYSWDEAIEGLYIKIRELEAQVMKTVDPDEMTETMNHLHTIRAHMLYYSSLLADFQKAVTFVKETRNPAIGDVKNDDQIRKTMKRECDHILTEITRIEKDCQMQDERLENASNLGKGRQNIYDSQQATKLNKILLRDSAVMKLLSYVTMVLLPADFTAEAFGINVAETNGSNPRLWTYVATAVPFTIFTVWLFGALQLPYMTNASAAEASKKGGFTWFSRLWWPVILIRTSLTDKAKNRQIRGLEYEYDESPQPFR